MKPQLTMPSSPPVNDRRLLRTLTAVALAGAAAIAVQAFLVNATFVHDDAYITLRYARNLLAGHGVVYNPGERVQGYTSVLHLGLVWLLGRTGMDLRAASRAIGLASFALLMAGACWLQRRQARANPADAFWCIPLLLIATSCPLIVWSLSGMEGVLFALLVAAGCLLFLASWDWPAARSLLAGSSVCFSLGFLARPEGAIFSAICIAWLSLSRRPGRGKDVAVFGAICLAVVSPYLLWQYLYYGDIVPNVFYAKVGVPGLYRLRNGLAYLVSYILLPPYLPIALAVLLAIGRRRVWSARLGFLLSIILVHATYLLYVGGDHMPAYRFLLPILVPLIYAVHLAMRSLLPRPSWQVVTGGFGVVLVLCSLQCYSETLNPLTDPAAEVGTVVGKYIAKAWPAGSLVALNTAGSTPYYAADLRFLDMLGLNDAHIARRQVDRIVLKQQEMPGHMKGDGAYVLSREPDYIILGTAEGTPPDQPRFLSDLEIVRDPRLGQRYQRHLILLDANIQPTGDLDRAVLAFRYFQKTGP